MCQWCEKARKSVAYTNFLREMQKEDMQRIEATKEFAQQLETVELQVCSSMEYPFTFLQPMFEARAAYAVPHNYYQNLHVQGERAGVAFAHGSMRSMFFAGSRLVLFSKNVQHREGREFFTSFVLLHLESKEFSFVWKENDLTVRAQVEKPMKNLLTGKVEKKQIAFNFVHQNVQNRIVSREQVMQSSLLKNVYKNYMGVGKKMASVDIEGYAITVPHFAPHPYLLQTHAKFGFTGNRDMQEHVLDYFRAHLS